MCVHFLCDKNAFFRQSCVNRNQRNTHNLNMRVRLLSRCTIHLKYSEHLVLNKKALTKHRFADNVKHIFDQHSYGASKHVAKYH